MTCTVSHRDFPTKKSFVEAVKAGHNVKICEPQVNGTARWSMRDVQDRVGYSFTVTNEYKRSWFASVEIKAGRKVVVR